MIAHNTIKSLTSLSITRTVSATLTVSAMLTALATQNVETYSVKENYTVRIMILITSVIPDRLKHEYNRFQFRP